MTQLPRLPCRSPPCRPPWAFQLCDPEPDRLSSDHDAVCLGNCSLRLVGRPHCHNRKRCHAAVRVSFLFDALNGPESLQSGAQLEGFGCVGRVSDEQSARPWSSLLSSSWRRRGIGGFVWFCCLWCGRGYVIHMRWACGTGLLPALLLASLLLGGGHSTGGTA